MRTVGLTTLDVWISHTHWSNHRSPYTTANSVQVKAWRHKQDCVWGGGAAPFQEELSQSCQLSGKKSFPQPKSRKSWRQATEHICTGCALHYRSEPVYIECNGNGAPRSVQYAKFGFPKFAILTDSICNKHSFSNNKFHPSLPSGSLSLALTLTT